jgi:hypothetical protein
MLPRQPRSRRGNEGLNASPQRRMHHWCELRVVVDRQLVESIVLLGFGIDRRIGAAYKPKYRGHLPLGAKRSEILARGRRPSLTNVLDAEMPAKRGHDALGRIPIVDVERITIQRRDFRFSRRTRGFRLRVDNPLVGEIYAGSARARLRPTAIKRFVCGRSGSLPHQGAFYRQAIRYAVACAVSELKALAPWPEDSQRTLRNLPKERHRPGVLRRGCATPVGQRAATVIPDNALSAHFLRPGRQCHRPVHGYRGSLACRRECG